MDPATQLPLIHVRVTPETPANGMPKLCRQQIVSVCLFVCGLGCEATIATTGFGRYFTRKPFAMAFEAGGLKIESQDKRRRFPARSRDLPSDHVLEDASLPSLSPTISTLAVSMASLSDFEDMLTPSHVFKTSSSRRTLLFLSYMSATSLVAVVQQANCCGWSYGRDDIRQGMPEHYCERDSVCHCPRERLCAIELGLKEWDWCTRYGGYIAVSPKANGGPGGAFLCLKCRLQDFNF
ncbi:hypothetical protein F5146DRAFT_1000130 [Armillaria mellea]|nr:hypothetical protein F5146DRAFT_1000130 [Armillaria mellea]